MTTSNHTMCHTGTALMLGALQLTNATGTIRKLYRLDRNSHQPLSEKLSRHRSCFRAHVVPKTLTTEARLRRFTSVVFRVGFPYTDRTIHRVISPSAKLRSG